ncbi:MAG: hypothetical protein JST30_07065 [Armatimonadetes bacterium]|nr:hypothetical protein [Armatimonadota bacterium]
MTVLVLLFTVLMPVFAKARRSAIISKSSAQMRQFQQALYLYQIDHDFQGGPSQIGLPQSLAIFRFTPYRYPLDMFKTGGTPKPGSKYAVYIQMFPSEHDAASSKGKGGESPWMTHNSRTGGNPVLLVDDSQNVEDSCTDCYFESRFGLGIYADGHVRRQWTKGLLARYEAWE